MKGNDYIKLRWKKLDGGKESAFLDITIPGKPRKKEYLKLYRGGDVSRKDSRYAERLALAIQQKRLEDLRNIMLGIEPDRSHTLFFKFYYECADAKEHKENTRKSWRHSASRIYKYVESIGKNPDELVFADIDYAFSAGYLNYLQNEATSAPRKWRGMDGTGVKKLRTSTVIVEFSMFRTAMDKALKAGIIHVDPSARCSFPRQERQKREYLSPEDLRLLMVTPYTSDALCRAFLFSCFTGLRISDIRAMTWGDVAEFDGHARITFRQVKTGGQMYLDISDLAFGYMGKRGDSADHVFVFQKGTGMCKLLLDWVHSAGINKHITFHCGRHTAAVAMLAAGAEIYTVSKVLGHASLSSTQVYAEIVDQKKTQAVDLIASLVRGTAEGQKLE